MGSLPKIVITVTNNTLIDQRVQRISKSPKRRGYEVVIVGNHRPPFIQKLNNLPATTQLIKTYFKKGPIFYFEFNIRLFCLLLFSEFDAIYSVDLDTILASRWASFFKGKKIIFDAHEHFTDTPEVTNRPFVRTVWKIVKKLAIWKIDLAITVNEEIAKILEKEDMLTYQVIRNLPIQSFQSDTSLKAEKILLYQGAINEGRCIELYISAMDLLQDYHLYIVGTGDLDQKIRDLIEESSSKERIIFKGPLLPNELVLLTRKAHIGLNLLEPTSKSYFYSLANKFFDYVQGGIPSINMNFPVYHQYLNEFKAGEMVSELSPEALSTAIHKIDSEINYSYLQENITKAASVWVWEKEEKKLLKVVDSILL